MVLALAVLSIPGYKNMENRRFKLKLEFFPTFAPGIRNPRFYERNPKFFNTFYCGT